MNSFISNLLARHLHTESNIKPLVRHQFENATDPFPEYDVEADLSKDEVLRTQPIETPEWKPRKDENKINIITEPVSEDEIKPAPEHDPLLVADLISIKRTDEDKKLASIKTDVENIDQINEETIGKKRSPISTKDSTLDHPGIIEKFFVTPVVEKQTGNFILHESVSQKPTPVLKKQKDTFLFDTGGNEMENDKHLNIFPLSVKRRSDDHLTASEKKSETRPVINVTIGSIEVKANFPAPESKTPPKKEPQGLLSLEQYLEQTKSGKR